MVDPLFKDTLDYWGNKNYWTVTDVLNLLTGGLEHTDESDYDWLNKVKEKILQAVANNTITSKEVNGQTLMKRDSLVLWASKNLKDFPFEPSDFGRVKSGRDKTKTESTQLRVIGLLAKAMATASPSNRLNDRPNVKMIARKCIAELQQLDKKGVDPTGLRDSNIREIISLGLKRLSEK